MLFETKRDVEWELNRCFDECIERGVKNIGETLYIEHFFFCNTSELIDPAFQNRIREYNFCQSFNCPPYPSLQQTPAKVLEEFTLIDHEVKYYHATKQKEKIDGSK